MSNFRYIITTSRMQYVAMSFITLNKMHCNRAQTIFRIANYCYMNTGNTEPQFTR